MTDYFIRPVSGSSANDGSSGSPWAGWADFFSENPTGTHVVNVGEGTDTSTKNDPTNPSQVTIQVDDDDYIARANTGYGSACNFDGQYIITGNGYGYKVLQEASGGRRGIDLHPGSGNTTEVNGIIVKHDGGGSSGPALNLLGAGTLKVQNASIISSNDDGINVQWSNGSPTAHIFNSTVNNCPGDGISRLSGTLHAKNNLVCGSTGNDFNGFMATKENCGSSDATGSTGKINLTAADEMDDPTDETFAGLGWKLKSTSNMVGAGSDLDADADLAVTDDFFGNARDASTPDVGAHEYQAAGGSSGSTTVSAGAGVTLAGSGDREGDTTASAGEGVAVSGSGARGGSVTASAGVGDALSGSGDRGGSTTASAPANLALSGSGARSGAISASAGASVATSGAGSRSGSVTASAGTGVTLSGSGPAGSGDVTVSAGAGVALSGSGSRSGSISEGLGEGVALAGSGGRSGSITASAGAAVTLSGSVAGRSGSTTVSAGAGVTLSGQRAGSGSVAFGAGSAIVLAGSGSRAGSVTINTGAGVTLSGFASQPDDVEQIRLLAGLTGARGGLTGKTGARPLSGSVN